MTRTNPRVARSSLLRGGLSLVIGGIHQPIELVISVARRYVSLKVRFLNHLLPVREIVKDPDSREKLQLELRARHLGGYLALCRDRAQPAKASPIASKPRHCPLTRCQQPRLGNSANRCLIVDRRLAETHGLTRCRTFPALPVNAEVSRS